jgi:hypothetical protein
MKAHVRAMWWVIFLTFRGLFTAFMVFAHFQTKGDRESREGYAQLSATRAALHSVYEKLSKENTNATNQEVAIIRPEDVRSAFARGTNDLGELPTWLTSDLVYIAKEDVSLTSGKFVCLVVFGKRVFPLYGLTSTGECRYTEAGEVTKKDLEKDFIPVSAER